MSDMPKEIWAFKIEESYEVLDPISYTTTMRTDVTNGFYDRKERDSTKYIRADLVEPQAIRADITDAKHPKQDALDALDSMSETLRCYMRDQGDECHFPDQDVHIIRNYIEGKDDA